MGYFDFGSLELNVVLRLLLGNGLLEDRDGKIAVNEERVDAVTRDPWSTSWINSSAFSMQVPKPYFGTCTDCAMETCFVSIGVK